MRPRELGMNEYIKKHKVPKNELEHSFTKFCLLADVISGVYTNYLIFKQRHQLSIKPDKNEIKIYLITKGSGEIECENKKFTFSELTVFIPGPVEPFTLNTVNAVEMIEIIMDLNHQDKEWLSPQKFPYFMTLSQCKPYKENIKSEKTVNYMLVPDDIVPRFSLGTVQTTGPDRVEAHSHPFLEQLFFGLGKNDCCVHADDHETRFGADTLLYIPSGSHHGVRVEDEKCLHYVWLDFFKTLKDIRYIRENHVFEDF